MSTNTQETAASSPQISSGALSASQKNQDKIDKKKLKLLKSALKDERAAKEAIEKELHMAIAKIEHLNKQNLEKETRFKEIMQENHKLTEALVNQSKQGSGGKPQQAPTPSASGKKDINQGMELAAASQATLDMLSQKVKTQEDTISKKDEEIRSLNNTINDYETQVIKLQKLFESKYQELAQQHAIVEQALAKRDEEKALEKMKYDDMLKMKEEEFNKRLSVLQMEIAHVTEERNVEMDKNLKVQEIIDQKDEQIKMIERDLVRKSDEADLRTEVINSLSQSLIAHETNQRELASKLVIMKNQIMETDIGRSIGRKFAAVRIGMIKNVQMTPVSIEFNKISGTEYMMSIESRQKIIQVELEAVESVSETQDGRLRLVYFSANPDGNGFSKKTETFDCFEINDIIKTFNSVKTIVESAALRAMDTKQGSGGAGAVSRSFAGASMFSRSKSTANFSPVKQQSKATQLLL